MKRLFLTIIVLTGLTACHNRLIHNRTDAYLDAKSIAPMKIPPDYTATNMTAYYPVPAIKEPITKPVDITPPTVSK